MDLEGMICPGCGSSMVTFNAKQRCLICNQCGKQTFYSRATLNANKKVMFCQQNALNFFKDGKFDDAQHYAHDVLNISIDNGPAIYILAYYDEFRVHRPDSIKRFFAAMKDVALEYDEVKDLMSLFLASAYNLADYEENVIELIAVNLQSDEDAADLCKFCDSFCAYLIPKRSSSGFLTPELAEMYQELASHCGIPRTCFALLKSITTIPDSPYSDNSFYLKSRSRYFYDNYVIPIGNIISAINDGSLRAKFMNSYNKTCAKFKRDSGIN